MVTYEIFWTHIYSKINSNDTALNPNSLLFRNFWVFLKNMLCMYHFYIIHFLFMLAVDCLKRICKDWMVIGQSYQVQILEYFFFSLWWWYPLLSFPLLTKLHFFHKQLYLIFESILGVKHLFHHLTDTRSLSTFLRYSN